ncbi:MAG: hypothetical protein MK082_07225 [Phycisphaerales bacterium]|nr:hypothetical protein [Phycisphaerales bacterium]
MTTPPRSDFSDIWPVLLVLVGVVVVGFIVIGIVRKWMRTESVDNQVGFTLSDLRRLHAEGKLSREELETAEKQMIAKVRETAADSDAIRIRPRTRQPHNRNDPQSPTEDEE